MYKKFIFSFFLPYLFLSGISGQDPDLVSSLKKHVAILASDSLEGRGFGFISK